MFRIDSARDVIGGLDRSHLVLYQPQAASDRRSARGAECVARSPARGAPARASASRWTFPLCRASCSIRRSTARTLAFTCPPTSAWLRYRRPAPLIGFRNLCSASRSADGRGALLPLAGSEYNRAISVRPVRLFVPRLPPLGNVCASCTPFVL